MEQNTIQIARETDLYLPIKKYLINQGFTVRGEVRDCDLAAIKNGQLLLVELKMSVTLDLILQGNERKRISDNVYLAVPRPNSFHTPRWRKILRLCRALGLGLLTVSPRGLVQAHCQSFAQAPRKSAQDKKLLLAEFANRSGDYNIGGSRGRPLVTAYREQALRIAQQIGDSRWRLRDIVTATGIVAAPGILQNNFYGWFERVERGTYALSPEGRQALLSFADVLD